MRAELWCVRIKYRSLIDLRGANISGFRSKQSSPQGKDYPCYSAFDVTGVDDGVAMEADGDMGVGVGVGVAD